MKANLTNCCSSAERKQEKTSDLQKLYDTVKSLGHLKENCLFSNLLLFSISTLNAIFINLYKNKKILRNCCC